MNVKHLSSIFVVSVLASASLLQAQGPVALKYKFTKGGTQYYKSIDEQKQSQAASGMKQPETTMTQETYLSRLVDAVDAGGKGTLKIKTEKLKLSGDLGPAGKYEFDSTAKNNDKTSAIGSQITPALERMVTIEYSVGVDARGNIVDIKGYAEMMAELLKTNPVAAQLIGGDTEAAAKFKEQQLFIPLSDKPVKPGDKWEVPVNVDLGKLGKSKGKSTYTYEGPDKVGNINTARISMTSAISMDISIDQGPAKITGKLETTKSTGTAHFDVEAGRIVSMKKSVVLDGKLNVNAGGMVIPVDTHQEQNTTFEYVDKLP